MSYGVKNGPPTYHKNVTKTFKEYLDNFMKIFLDDFIVYNHMEVICKSSNYVFKNAKNMALV